MRMYSYIYSTSDNIFQTEAWLFDRMNRLQKELNKNRWNFVIKKFCFYCHTLINICQDKELFVLIKEPCLSDLNGGYVFEIFTGVCFIDEGYYGDISYHKAFSTSRYLIKNINEFKRLSISICGDGNFIYNKFLEIIESKIAKKEIDNYYWPPLGL